MELNIILDLSEAQIEYMREHGGLTLKIKPKETNNEGVVYCEVEDVTEPKWPDSAGNGDVADLINIAKHFRLSPGDLHKLSRSRVKRLIFGHSGQYTALETEVDKMESIIGQPFEADLDGSDTINELFGSRVMNALVRAGYYVYNETDMRTMTLSQLRSVRYIGDDTLKKIEEYFESKGIQLRLQ